MSGLLDMLTRVQNSRVDDQRGLLTKEQLEVPSFLQLPAEQDSEHASTTSSSSTDSKTKSENKKSLTENSGGAVKKAPDSAKSESPDMKETTV